MLAECVSNGALASLGLGTGCARCLGLSRTWRAVHCKSCKNWKESRRGLNGRGARKKRSHWVEVSEIMTFQAGRKIR